MNPILIIVHIHSIFKYHISIPYSLSYYIFKDILNLCTYFIYSFISSFMCSFHILISYTHSHTHSCIHSRILIHILIHVYSFIYSFTYSFMYTHSYTHSRIIIHILIHVLISYTHSCILIHIFINILVHVYSFIYFLSFVIFFWLYMIIIIYNLTTLCVYDNLSFMSIFMFLFILIFHITFMFHEHIYTYFISCLYLHPFLPCILINFNQVISTLVQQFNFRKICGHKMPLNSILLDSRLNDLSIESKNTHNGVLTKELCKLQAVTKISNLQHLQQQQHLLSFVIFGDLNFTFETFSLY